MTPQLLAAIAALFVAVVAGVLWIWRTVRRRRRELAEWPELACWDEVPIPPP